MLLQRSDQEGFARASCAADQHAKWGDRSALPLLVVLSDNAVDKGLPFVELGGIYVHWLWWLRRLSHRRAPTSCAGDEIGAVRSRASCTPIHIARLHSAACGCILRVDLGDASKVFVEPWVVVRIVHLLAVLLDVKLAEVIFAARWGVSVVQYKVLIRGFKVTHVLLVYVLDVLVSALEWLVALEADAAVIDALWVATLAPLAWHAWLHQDDGRIDAQLNLPPAFAPVAHVVVATPKLSEGAALNVGGVDVVDVHAGRSLINKPGHRGLTFDLLCKLITPLEVQVPLVWIGRAVMIRRRRVHLRAYAP